MKKSAKPAQKQSKTAAKPKAADGKSSAPAVKLNHADRARQRVESSRQAAINKVVSQSPE